MMSYKNFVIEVQDQANEFESLPNFRLARGSAKEFHVLENLHYHQQVVFSSPLVQAPNAPLNNFSLNFIPPSNFTPSSNYNTKPATHVGVNRDGDIKKGGGYQRSINLNAFVSYRPIQL